MTSEYPETKALLRRMAECKAKMISLGIYLRPVNLSHTNVQQTWERAGWKPPFGNTVSLPVSVELSTSSTLVPFAAKSAVKK